MSIKCSAYYETTSIEVSEKFRVRFYDVMSQRSGAMSNFIDTLRDYAGEFISKGESFKLRYKDVVIVIDDGILVNVFRDKK